MADFLVRLDPPDGCRSDKALTERLLSAGFRNWKASLYGEMQILPPGEFIFASGMTDESQVRAHALEIARKADARATIDVSKLPPRGSGELLDV